MRRMLIAAAALLVATAAFAQVTPDEDLTAIQDNSFLLEEAYNQDAGVVQHISVFLRDTDADAWTYVFTQEWPVTGLKHQLSYAVPLHGNGSTELGDVMLNYRYQLTGSAETNFAIAPRLSVILPTSDSEDDGIGVQVGLPISRVFAPRLIGHTNLGATWSSDGGDTEWTAGQSFIYAATSRMHLMLEGTYTRAGEANAFLVNPAVRWAFNLAGGLQIVPGIGVPIGFGDDESKSVLVYLSFEK